MNGPSPSSKSSHAFTVIISLTIMALAPVATTLGAPKPNVLFISVDDLRCDLGCYGAKHIHSPHIDRLAANAVTFTRAYVQQAVCNPSRASIMTGLRPDTTRVWDLATEFRTTLPNAVTLPQHFRKHDYVAVSFGKIFHNPWPDQVSWSQPHRWPKKASLWSTQAKKQWGEFKKQMRAEGRPEKAIQRVRALATESVDIPDASHVDGAIATQTIEAMRELAKGNRPFFLAAGFIRPHLPFVVPKIYWDMYKRANLSLAKNPHLPRNMPGVAFGDRSRGGFYELTDYMDYLKAPSPLEQPLTEAQQRELRHGYYAAVSFVDAQVGRLLGELERLQLADKTVVVLWSDHGYKLGEHRGWCKQTNFEIDTRAPLIIKMPGVEGNGQPCRSLVEFVDIYPTLCDLAGLPIPQVLEGQTLRPLLNDPTHKIKTAAFSQFPRTHRRQKHMGYAIRTERHRYIAWVAQDSGNIAQQELYDHQTDPGENFNVAGNGANATLIQQLQKQLWKQFDRSIFLKRKTKP